MLDLHGREAALHTCRLRDGGAGGTSQAGHGNATAHAGVLEHGRSDAILLVETDGGPGFRGGAGTYGLMAGQPQGTRYL